MRLGRKLKGDTQPQEAQSGGTASQGWASLESCPRPWIPSTARGTHKAVEKEGFSSASTRRSFSTSTFLCSASAGSAALHFRCS